MIKTKKYLRNMVAVVLLVGVLFINAGDLGAAEDVDMNKIERHYTVKVFVDTAENEVVFPAGMGRPFIALDRTYVPYRILAERMGAEVGWVDSERKVKAENEKNKVEMVIGSQTYKTNGIEKQMEVSPFILSGEGRSYVPARFLTEGLGYKINFAQDGKIMYVCSFTKGQTDAEMKEVLEEIVGKGKSGKTPVEETPVVENPVVTGGITSESQLTPELIQMVKDKRAIEEYQKWEPIEDKYYQIYNKVIEEYFRDSGKSVVVSNNLVYIQRIFGSEVTRYRAIVNGNELWSVTVGYTGKRFEVCSAVKIENL